jgi:hypothetical protein
VKPAHIFYTRIADFQIKKACLKGSRTQEFTKITKKTERELEGFPTTHHLSPNTYPGFLTKIEQIVVIGSRKRPFSRA